MWDDPGHKNTVKRCDPPCVKKFRNFGMVPKISQWFRKLGMVAKIRDGSDLRNNYENVATLSTLGKFSKIGSTYLWLLPSSAFNYLRHLFTRCSCFFLNILVVRKFFANFHLKVSYNRSTFWSTQQLKRKSTVKRRNCCSPHSVKSASYLARSI